MWVEKGMDSNELTSSFRACWIPYNLFNLMLENCNDLRLGGADKTYVVPLVSWLPGISRSDGEPRIIFNIYFLKRAWLCSKTHRVFSLNACQSSTQA